MERRLVFLTVLFTVIGFVAAVSARACDMTSAYIMNLSQERSHLNASDLCNSNHLSRGEQWLCVQRELTANLEDSCRKAIDIFVPGSNAEHGAWKQFNTMFYSDNDRGHVSLQYGSDAEADSERIELDSTTYDRAVLDARKSLMLLLDAINEGRAYGMGPETRVRVFGHGQGSHAVSLVAGLRGYEDFEFYAFGQPGRTAMTISEDPEIGRGLLGKPGFIQKLDHNLVGITWSNDEIRFFKGFEGYAGGEVPDTWGYPGLIKDWDSATIGALYGDGIRIDHHNNYGGRYTDGWSDNDWRKGHGSKANGFPYCATGARRAFELPECDRGDVDFAPWFWGHAHCQAEAFRMMKAGEIKDRYWIGESGPRDRTSCELTDRYVVVEYEARYRFSMKTKGKNCSLRLNVSFSDKLAASSFTLKGDSSNDNSWRVASGQVVVPVREQAHLRLKLDHAFDPDPGEVCLAPLVLDARDTVFLDHVTLTTTHPGLGGKVERTVIGNQEGRDIAGHLYNSKLSAWTASFGPDEDPGMTYRDDLDAIEFSKKIGGKDIPEFTRMLSLFD